VPSSATALGSVGYWRRRGCPTWATGSPSDEADEQGVQGDIAVVVELAHRDTRPVSGPHEVCGIVPKPDKLADAQARAGQQLDH
jgi:hypothetical protein